ncbi:MAG: 50S ribosomal protein L11, partial [Candidatus Woesearchaeota archaeon]
GTPPASELIKQEAGVKKAAGNPKTDKAGEITFAQIIKIAGMKQDSLLGKNKKQQVKEILGTCNAMGIHVDGKRAIEIIAAVNAGTYDSDL